MPSTPILGQGPTTEHPTGPTTPPSRLADRLADTLRSEAALLTELSATMQRQRDAVARDDLDSIDESVFATHRVLTTLGETRRRRRMLAELLGENSDLSLSALERYFRGAPPANVRAATDELSEAARNLQRQVDLNRRVLRRAIEASDAYVRSLCHLPAAPSVGYSDGTQATDKGLGGLGGAIVDRRI
jgi:hypothetical protein